MNRSKSRHQDSEDQIRKKILQNTILYNDNRKSLVNDSPLSLLQTYQKEQSVPDTRSQTDRNMKFKLDQLQDKLDEMSQGVHAVRQQYRELIDYTTRTKKLLNMKVGLEGNIQGLANQIRIARQAADQRYTEIRNNCSEIWNRTEQLRQHVFSLTMRIERLEEKMGFKQSYRLQYL